MGPKATPSQRHLTAVKLVQMILNFRRTLVAIDGRGGIVSVLDDSRLDEAKRRPVVSALRKIHDKTRNYVVAVGDDRRARGIATPLCWLPEDSQEATP
jgi:hypothetical protein